MYCGPERMLSLRDVRTLLGFVHTVSGVNIYLSGFVMTHYAHVTYPCIQLFKIINASGAPLNFVRGGVQQIQLRTKDRENGDLGAVAP